MDHDILEDTAEAYHTRASIQIVVAVLEQYLTEDKTKAELYRAGEFICD